MKNLDNVIKTLRKLKEMAERGVGGEKSNAKELYLKLSSKYNLNIDEIDQERVLKTYYTTQQKDVKQLLFQVFFHVTNIERLTYKEVGRSKIAIKATEIEHKEIDFIFSKLIGDYQKQKKKSINDFLEAYVAKHGLYSNRKNKVELKDISVEDLEKMMRVCAMSEGIDRVEILKAIE